MGNNCDIWIERNQPDCTSQAGDTVAGTVHVEVNKDCQCDDLILTLEWYTHGRGNTVVQCIEQQSLFRGEWTAGEHHEYEFETTLPPGPYTYRGNYLNVDWRLKAEADISWGTDSSAEQEVLLDPSGSEDRFRAGDEEVIESIFASADDDQTVSRRKVLFGGIFLALGLPGLVTAVVSWRPVVGLFSMLFVAPGGYLAYRATQNVLAEQRLGDVDVQLDPAEVRPGETIRCRVRADPPDPVEVNEVTVRLHGYERVVSGGRTRETVYTHTVYDETKTMSSSENATITGGTRTFKTDFTLPDSAPYSFHADDNELTWEMEVRVDVPSWPDWSHTEPLLVQPKTKS